MRTRAGGLRSLLPGRAGPRRPLRRMVLHRRHLDRDLLPARAARPPLPTPATCASSRAPPPPSRPASGPACAAGPTPAPGRRNGTGRADVVARAMQLIADGTVDREGVGGLAAPPRLRRAPAPPAAGGRGRDRRPGPGPGPTGPDGPGAGRDDRSARSAHVAFAAGFAQRPPVQRHRPPGLRPHARPNCAGGRGRHRRGVAGTRARQELQSPSDWRTADPSAAGGSSGFLAARAVPGLEGVDAGGYQRSLRLPHAEGSSPSPPTVTSCGPTLQLADLRDLGAAVNRCRRLLDLDADPVAVDERAR